MVYCSSLPNLQRVEEIFPQNSKLNEKNNNAIVANGWGEGGRGARIALITVNIPTKVQ